MQCSNWQMQNVDLRSGRLTRRTMWRNALKTTWSSLDVEKSLSSGILGRQCTVLINNLTYYQNSPMSIQMTSVPLGPELTYPSKQAQEWLPGLLIHFWEQSPLFTWHSLMSWQVRPSSFKENPAGHEQWNDPSVFAQEYSQSPFPLFLAHSFMSTQLRDLVKN